MKSNPPFPFSKEGSNSDIENLVHCESEKEAAHLFNLGAIRLLNINEWDQFAGPRSPTFKLTDKQGQHISRQAAPGDYFEIDIPGPNTQAGKDNDWVKIESLDDFRDPTGTVEEVSFRVRLASSPLSSDHFFTDHAPSTFSIIRNGLYVKAEVHGRNDDPNTHVEKTGEAFHHTFGVIGAISGLAKVQWKNLVKGLLKVVR